MKNIIPIFSIIIMAIFCSCHKKETINSKTEFSLKDQLDEKINNFIDSSICVKDRIIELRHQKYNGKNYIQISTNKIFMPDSLYVLKEHKQEFLIAFYNKEYFENIIKRDSVKNSLTISKNKNLNFNEINFTETGIPCYDMYELINNSLKKVPSNSYVYNNLFANPPMDFPSPPPSKNEK